MGRRDRDLALISFLVGRRNEFEWEIDHTQFDPLVGILPLISGGMGCTTLFACDCAFPLEQTNSLTLRRPQPKQKPAQINKQNLLDCMESKLTFKSLIWLLWSRGGWGKTLLEILLLGLTPHWSVVAMVNSFSKDHIDTRGWNFVIYFELWGI